jgi:hypothetical protein
MGTRNEVKEWLIGNDIAFDQSLESDPLGMGRSLLWYYAFNIPYVLGFSSPVGIKFQEGMFELSFFAGRQDVNYSVEQSSDLFSWTTEGIEIFPLDEMGYKKASITTSSGRAFSRVKVLGN